MKKVTIYDTFSRKRPSILGKIKVGKTYLADWEGFVLKVTAIQEAHPFPIHVRVIREGEPIFAETHAILLEDGSACNNRRSNLDFYLPLTLYKGAKNDKK